VRRARRAARPFVRAAADPVSPRALSSRLGGAAAEAKPSLWARFKHELHHYWIGSKLLYAETRISLRLINQLLRGQELSRRERKQVRGAVRHRQHRT